MNFFWLQTFFPKLSILDVYGSHEYRSELTSRKIYLWENLYYPRHHWRHQSEENITSLLFIDFEKAIDSIHRGNIKENPLVCGILEATTKTIEKLYTNVKAQVIIIDGDKEPFDITYFDITAGITQFDTLASFTYLIWLCTWSK